jgi:DnaJ-class molecular chaperone
MTKLEELTWEEIRLHLNDLVEGTSDLDQQKRERLIAHALVLTMQRLDGPAFRRKDLIERCPDCHGTGKTGEPPSSGRHMSQRGDCAGCDGRGERLTEAGRAVMEAAKGRWPPTRGE